MARTRARKRTKKTKWDELSPPVKAAIWTGAGVVAFLGGRFIYLQVKNSEIRNRLRNRKQHQVTPSVNLSSTAFNIHDAFYNADWFGFTEDEDTAIREVLRVPQEHIPKLADIYAEMFNEDLYGDFRRFLDSEDYSRVRSHLETTMNENGDYPTYNIPLMLAGAGATGVGIYLRKSNPDKTGVRILGSLLVIGGIWNTYYGATYGSTRAALDQIKSPSAQITQPEPVPLEDNNGNKNGRVLLGSLLCLDGMSNNNLTEILGGALLVGSNMQQSQPQAPYVPPPVTVQPAPGTNIQQPQQPAPINVGGYTFTPGYG